MDYVTYDPDDDKLRVYFASRQPEEVLQPLKNAGFRWAGKQACWFAVWTPEREDVAFAAAGEAIAEGSTREARAAERAERFQGYGDNAERERDRRHDFVRGMTDALNGQPVLIGHHSEKRHRKLLSRMDDAMRSACAADRRASYWESRASGAVAHAARMDRPDVRARRIKTLEADARKWERHLADGRAMLAGLALDGKSMYAVACTVRWNHIASALYDALRIEDEAQRNDAVASVAANAKSSVESRIGWATRWAEHTAGRIAYEREQLEAQGATHRLDPKPRKKQPPILNIRNVPAHVGRWGQEVPASVATECTSADYARVHRDYKGTRTIGEGENAYRVRTAMESSLPSGGRGLVIVFLTDKREDATPV